MSKIGYARVSTEQQNLDMQRAALLRAGCDQMFEDHGMSGADFTRPGLKRALRRLRRGDVLVVWRLDRLGRSLAGLVRTINQLAARGIEFQSLTEAIDTTTCGGRLLFHVMAALAEFERSLISERTREGMAMARAQGRHVGRPPSLSPSDKQTARRAMLRHQPLDEVAASFGVHPRTLRRAISSIGVAEHSQSKLC